VFVPGYGLRWLAQAQAQPKEPGRLRKPTRVAVSYAIHPVAGRMPAT